MAPATTTTTTLNAPRPRTAVYPPTVAYAACVITCMRLPYHAAQAYALDSQKNTPLHLAAMRGQEALVDLLLERADDKFKVGTAKCACTIYLLSLPPCPGVLEAKVTTQQRGGSRLPPSPAGRISSNKSVALTAQVQMLITLLRCCCCRC